MCVKKIVPKTKQINLEINILAVLEGNQVFLLKY